MSVSEIMWVEKYRPKKISEIVGQKEIIGSLTSLLKNQAEMPHLLFSGSAGVGKTTTAVCLSREIHGDRWKDYTRGPVYYSSLTLPTKHLVSNTE